MPADSDLCLSAAPSVLDEAPFGFHLYRLCPGNRLVFEGANATANAMLHVDHRQFVGKTIEEAFPSLTNTEIPERYRGVASSGEAWKTDQVDYDEQGIRGAFEVRAVPMSASRVAVFFTDITDRLRIEHELRVKQAELDSYFTHARDLLSIVSRDGRFKRVNPEWERVLGYPVAELLGQPYLDFVHPDDLAATREVQGTVGRSDQAQDFVNRYRCKDGSFRHIEWRSVPTGADTYAYARDVTERIEMMNRARESEALYHGLVNTMSELVSINELVFDDQGKPIDWRVVDVNPAWEKALGLRRERQVGTLASEGYGGVLEHLDEFASVALGGPPLRFDTYDRTYDRHALVSVTSPRRGLFVVVASDITERVQMEQKLERALQELTVKTQELESLLYVTTHDLRSPLVNIQGFSARIERSLAELDMALAAAQDGGAVDREALARVSERTHKSLGFIAGSTQKMDRLIGGLLQLSRLGRRPLQWSTVDVESLWRQVLGVFQHQLREAQVTIETGVLPTCRGDASQLDQVLSNLLDNAIKYREPGRPCVVSFSGSASSDGTVRYRFSDTGRGIESQCIDRIWELFHRLAPNTDVSGEGIGLTAVRQILSRHGGEVTVESEPGVGSTFWLKLPGAAREVPLPSQTGATHG